MSDPIIKLLRACCVKFPNNYGTGCFVSPNLLVTCAHVIPLGKNKGNTVAVFIEDELVTARIEKISHRFYEDFCILSTGTKESENYVILDDNLLNTNDEVYCDGFPVIQDEEEHINGYLANSKIQYSDGFSGFYESSRNIPGYVNPVHKLKQTQISDGFSGAPVVRLDNGACIGIVMASRDVNLDIGGYLISASLLKDKLKTISGYTIEQVQIEKWRDAVVNRTESLNFGKNRNFPNTEESEKIIWLHYYLLPQQFIGRSNYIELLTNIIEKNNGPKANIVCITGIGGTGKSCFVRKIVEEIRPKKLPYKHVIWFSFAEAKTENSEYFFRLILEKIDANLQFFLKEKDQIQKKEFNPIINDELLRKRLCDLIDHAPILLFLDNLELIQNTSLENTLANYGTIKKEFVQLAKLFEHVLSGANSLIIVTSRLNLNTFDSTSGYKEISLNSLELSEGVDLLLSLGVKGSMTELQGLSKTLGNHALCLKSAAVYIAKKNLSPSQFKSTYLSKAFESSQEGAKMIELLNLYKDLLSEEQEYFLMMMSLNLRPVTNNNLPALVKKFDFSEEAMDYIEERIISPLLDLKLIDKVLDDKNTISYNCHPLMSFAYKLWFNTPLENAYEVLAESALADAANINTLFNAEDIQPYFDCIYYYLAANMFREAYEIINQIWPKIVRFQRFELTFSYLLQIEEAYLCNKFIPKDEIEEMYFFNYLAYTSKKPKVALGYRLKGFEVAKKHRSAYTAEWASFLISDFIINGDVKLAEEMFINYIQNKGLTQRDYVYENILKAEFENLKGNYNKASELFSIDYEIIYDSHKKCQYAQDYIPILISIGDLTKAKSVAEEAMQLALNKGFNCCVLSLYDGLIEIEVENQNIQNAKTYYSEQIKYSTIRGMDYSVTNVFQLAMANYEEVIDLCKKKISSDQIESDNKVEEIESLVFISKALKEQGLLEESATFSKKAMQLMEKYNIYIHKRRLRKWNLLVE